MYKIDDVSMLSIATGFKREFNDVLKCTNINADIWLKFQETEHRWNKIDGLYIRWMVDEYAKKYVNEIRKSLCEKIKVCDTTDNNDSISHQTRIYTNICNKLNNPMFTIELVKICRVNLYDNRFREKLDCNSHLLGFTNGVYDLKNRIFRNGIFSDYISMTTGYAYIQYETDSIEVEHVRQYFQQIQQNHDDKEYLYRYMISLFDVMQSNTKPNEKFTY